MARGRTYRRYATRLRFESGQPVPQAGAKWVSMTEIGGFAVRVRLLAVNRVFAHPEEPGVTLMDAKISMSRLW